MLNKLKEQIRKISDRKLEDGEPFEPQLKALTCSAKKMMVFSKNCLIKTFCHGKYAEMTFLPFESEMYDPDMIPFPSNSPLKRLKEKSLSQKPTLDEEVIGPLDKDVLTNALCSMLYQVKLEMCRLRLHQSQKKIEFLFPEMLRGAKCELNQCFRCTVLHRQRPLQGNLYIANEILFFVSRPFQEVSLSDGDVFPRYDNPNSDVRVKEAIAINEIVSIFSCIMVKNLFSSHVDAARTVTLLPLPDQGIEYNTIILYLQDKRRIVISDVMFYSKGSFFYGFNDCTKFDYEPLQSSSSDMSPIRLLHTYLDMLWRDSCTVPYTHVQYNEDVHVIP